MAKPQFFSGRRLIQRLVGLAAAGASAVTFILLTLCCIDAVTVQFIAEDTTKH
jgi:hypothetical protein